MKKISCIFVLLLCLFSEGAYSIGEFALGMGTGVAHDPNGIEGNVDQYNRTLMAYNRAVKGSKIEKINVPFYPVLGLSLRYHFNYLLLRAGLNYTTALFFPPSGSIKSESIDTDISIDSWQFSMPASIGFLLPLRDRTFFFFAAGLSYYVVHHEISQNRVSGIAGLPSEKDGFFEGDAGGFHFLFGGEVPILQRYTIAFEWLRQFCQSGPVENDKGEGTRAFNFINDTIIVSINYYVVF